ncbi:hypothetical protein PPL_11353 [Heterostelium album PN500]|uniref:Ankyrin repeat protein n=1 Tax=Heterostelium pallidum (strain ATCC 26659 / Pp 5 / PN500) TaxID=670386 RepID=D3BT61_HETP5|nr:hypothetical protein PPL_11353 [Heterostelium album PN500]EFA75278.1 hypothetical protein PPL_11353 [Heterostelium album PN500]|eukprot:XP_020427412.1 hypothetical protein PPL_11353 [Heterostelium album PN500]
MKQSLFQKVFNNKIINKTIFQNVSDIHQKIKKQVSFNYSKLIDYPHVLSGNNYLQLLEEYFERNEIHSFSEFQLLDRNSQILINAARSGSLDVLRMLFSKYVDTEEKLDAVTKGDLLYCASMTNGNIKTVEFLCSYSNHWDYYESMLVAPFSQDLEILKYIVPKVGTSYVKEEDDQSTVFDACAQIGRVDMIDSMFHMAIEGGHFHVLEYLAEQNKDQHIFEPDICPLIDYSALKNRLDIMKWLHDKQIGNCKFAINHAVENNNIEMLIWLQTHRPEGTYTREAFDNAFKHGNLEMLQLLYNQKKEIYYKITPIDPNSIIRAVIKAISINYYQMVEWLLNHTEISIIELDRLLNSPFVLPLSKHHKESLDLLNNYVLRNKIK